VKTLVKRTRGKSRVLDGKVSITLLKQFSRLHATEERHSGVIIRYP
jgi:hypothetical protein